VKILYWDRDGWVIWYKRLEAARSVSVRGDGAKRDRRLGAGSALEGIDLKQGRRRKRYSLPAVQGAWGERRAAVSGAEESEAG